MARRTSAVAYEQIQSEGLLSKMRFATYEILYHHGPLTGAEVDQIGTRSGNRGHLHKRLPELESRGVATCLPTRVCTVTGREAHEWDVTDALPVEPPPKESKGKPPKKVLRAALRNLDELRGHRTQDLEQVYSWLLQQAGNTKRTPEHQTMEDLINDTVVPDGAWR